MPNMNKSFPSRVGQENQSREQLDSHGQEAPQLNSPAPPMFGLHQSRFSSIFNDNGAPDSTVDNTDSTNLTKGNNTTSDMQQEESTLNFSPGSSIQRASSTSSTSSSVGGDASNPTGGDSATRSPRDSSFFGHSSQHGSVDPSTNSSKNQPAGDGRQSISNSSFVSSPGRSLSSMPSNSTLSPSTAFQSSSLSPSRDLSAFSNDSSRSPLNHSSGMWNNEHYSSPVQQQQKLRSLNGGVENGTPKSNAQPSIRQLADQFDKMSFGPSPSSGMYDMHGSGHMPQSHAAPPHHAMQAPGMHYFAPQIHPHQQPMMHPSAGHRQLYNGDSSQMHKSQPQPPHGYQDRLVTPPRPYPSYGPDLAHGMIGGSVPPSLSAQHHHMHQQNTHPMHHPYSKMGGNNGPQYSANVAPQYPSRMDHHSNNVDQHHHYSMSHHHKSSRRAHNSKMMNFSSVKEVKGRIYELAKDQYGCRFLQKKLEEQDADEVDLIFAEVYPHICELMVDPFGNYLCQKLVEHCSDNQKTKIIHSVSKDLVKISTNMHGTRAVQKLIECISTAKQIKLVTRSLKSHVVSLIKDLNGNHVIQRCLQKLSAKDKQFIYDAVAGRCVEVATHKHGCCVLQRCVDYASSEQKNLLNKEIIHNALSLVQNPFGNYVVQYILDLGDAEVNNLVIRKFLGSIYVLSTNKFSSNVIEKCLRISNSVTRQELVDELANLPSLCTVLQDSYGNYVIQTALTVADPAQFEELASVLKPQLHLIKNTPFGKKIENRLNKSKGSRSRQRNTRMNSPMNGGRRL